LSYLVLIGVVNSVNLTDGIDGLAASVTFTVGILFAFVGITLNEKYTIAFFGALLIGSSLGFLSYNYHPACVFMGDTGSLYLGGIIAASALMLGNIFLSLIYGFVFVSEAFSDILQVAYFKITKGRRLFKMAPLHHHFEKIGWSEIKIVTVFSLVNILFCVISFFGINI
jgi:phospho-N-acetylmuramoyl-pentapeptide-transferase